MAYFRGRQPRFPDLKQHCILNGGKFMLKISIIPVMLRMVSKLDLTKTVKQLKELDIFGEGQTKLSPEEMGVLAFETLAALLPQLDKIGSDIPEFVALYKGISVAEAGELDIADVIAEIKNDEGVLSFFKRALRKKVEQ